MANSNNKQSSGFFSNAVGVAKKLSSTGTSLLNHVAPDSVAKLTQASSAQSAIEGKYQVASVFTSKVYDNPQQVLREHLPNVSRQFLGRHYSKVNNVANFVSPQFSDKVSDYLFDQLNQLSNNMSSVDAVLDEAGVRDLEELTQDVDRSKRLSQALVEQNKWLASLQGALTGATGVLGSTIDIPASLLMSLRIIYQVGRSYGFDLSKESDQEIVQHIFRQIDLGVIAEKQTLLLALKALSSTIQTHDLSQLQQMLGSSNDVEALKKYFVDAQGEYKLGWLNQLSKVSLLDKLARLTPLAGAGISAVYSLRLVDEVNQKAQQVFSQAREYLIQHKDTQLSPLLAYEKSMELLAQAAPKLMESVKAIEQNLIEPVLNKAIDIEGNENITQVKVLKKTLKDKEDEASGLNTQDEQITNDLVALAEKEVAPSDDVPPQQAALANDQDAVWQDDAPLGEKENLGKTSALQKDAQLKK
ncbi:EcsC family protein [Acinetobacter sp. SWAC5]|uniref:EcsC family protein n=1 Tax=Acinetobacter sp. SWAC5 TaxID=2293835 RepID=UPI000E354399|nr:EcsC family protein [Acinetobacter sp. SWAC5]RFS26183.1 EcsC family protein [Acinetobacter sp. SWAC5]